jgi:hypothetical protein
LRLEAVIIRLIPFCALLDRQFHLGILLAHNSVPAGSCVFATGLLRRSLSALALPPESRVAGRWPLPFRPARGAEAKAPLG